MAHSVDFCCEVGVESGKVTLPAPVPTVLLSQFLYTDSFAVSVPVHRQFCCLSSCTPTVLLSQFLYTDSSALSVPAHRQFCCLSYCTPPVLLSQFLHTDSSAVSVPAHRQFCCLSSCTPTVTAHRHCTIRCTADRVINYITDCILSFFFIQLVMQIWMSCKPLNLQELISLGYYVCMYVCIHKCIAHTSPRTLCFHYKDLSIYAVCGCTVSVIKDSCAIYPDCLWGPPATYQLIPAVRIRCVKLFTHCTFSAGFKKTWSYSSTPLIKFHHI
jgi:hypothetical protein